MRTGMKNGGLIVLWAGVMLLSVALMCVVPPSVSITNAGETTIEAYPVRIVGAVPRYFATLQEAYDTAADGDVIQVRAIVFNENLTINRNITVTFDGGYDAGFSRIIGNVGNKSTLRGKIQGNSGNVILKNFVLYQ